MAVVVVPDKASGARRSLQGASMAVGVIDLKLTTTETGPSGRARFNRMLDWGLLWAERGYHPGGYAV